MKTKTQFLNRILSLMLSIMMVVSMLPMNGLTASAAEGDVASVTTADGTQTYADLASAFAAAEQAENAVLTLLADITISSTVYVEGGKFTVDLNGKTWTANNRALGILGADILITDSTADGLGKIVGTTVNSTVMIGNGTKLEVAGGTVENTRDGRCIDTQYNGHTSDAQFTLSGGKLITAGWSAIHVACTSVTIKNGEIKSQGDAYYHGDDHDYRSGLLDFSQHPDPTGIAVINYASVEIIPGDTTIKLPAGYCFYEQDANQPVTALPADMTNGYIIGKAPACTCEEKCSIHSTNSACTLCSADIAFCTGGVQAQAKIGDTYYTTLVEAAAKVTEGDTIEVLTDVTIGADETVTFAAFTHLNVAEGKTVTCSGTVKIGEEDGIIFENTLYYYGGDRTNEEWRDFQTILQLTCWTAGEGHVTYDPESNTLSLYNATSTFCPNSASNGCLEYAQESASEPMTINFRGVNTLTSENRQVFWIETPVTMNGIGPNAVLNVIGLDTNLHEPCCRFESDLTVNSGTVNIRANFALGCTELTVASGAELNAAGGYDASGVYFVLRTGKITGDGTVNALVLDGSATNETTQLPYVVYGNAALENDLLLQDLFAGTEDAGLWHFAFIVPQNSKLTVNEGVTLDLSTVALENIDFSGTVINDGTILLPEDFALDNAPKSGTVKLGERGYTWDPETGNWRCNDEAHTGGTATCTTPAVCDTCGESYGDVDTNNHDSSVECENGFCPNGCYEPAVLVTNENYESFYLKADYVGYYAISNAGQLFWFAQQVNEEGNKEIKGVITADIDLENRPWTPIGAMGEENSFRGVFDGQHYTIWGLYVEGSENGVGFFGEVRTGTVKNFHIYGNVVVNTEVDYVGGVIGSICGVNGETVFGERNGAVIQHVASIVNITVKAHGVGMIGGLVGHADHESLIEQCVWSGTFNAGEYRVDSGAGGFIGKIQENTSEVTIRNCGAYGTIKTGYEKNSYNNYATIYMGGFLSFSNTNAKTTLENCLFAGRFECGENLTDEAFLGAFGTLRSVKAIKNCYYLGDDGLAAVHSDSDLKPGSDNVEITKVTEDDLRNGTIAIQLGEYWTQGEDYPSPNDIGGHIHSHSYTYTDNGDGTHDQVCRVCDYVEVDNEAHTVKNHVCTDCGLALVQASVDQMVLRPGVAGIYFTGSFYIDPSVSAKHYGIALSLVSQQPKADGTDFFSLWTQGSTSVLVTNILDGEADDGKNAEMVIYARPYVLLEDGTYFYGQVQQASLREVVTAADARWNELTDVQKDAFRSMYTTFRATMEPWALPNLKENLA